MRVYLDTPPLAVVASPTALGMASPLQPLSLLRRQSTEAHVHGIVVIVTAAGQAPRAGIGGCVHPS